MNEELEKETLKSIKNAFIEFKKSIKIANEVVEKASKKIEEENGYDNYTKATDALIELFNAHTALISYGINMEDEDDADTWKG